MFAQRDFLLDENCFASYFTVGEKDFRRICQFDHYKEKKVPFSLLARIDKVVSLQKSKCESLLRQMVWNA
jgi:hypothetical protein